MKTTLQVFCEAMGWQGGTIHDAKQRFAIERIETMDKVCGRLADQIKNISDPEEARWFMRHRLDALGLMVLTVP